MATAHQPVHWPLVQGSVLLVDVESGEQSPTLQAVRFFGQVIQPGAPLRHIHIGRTVILVDDGLATGSSMKAAVAAVRERKPAHVVVAAPVAPPSTCEEIASDADDMVCVVTPEPFYGVAAWYEDFTQTTDEEVRDLLEAQERRTEEAAGSPSEGA